jgi:hypothetical protein
MTDCLAHSSKPFPPPLARDCERLLVYTVYIPDTLLAAALAGDARQPSGLQLHATLQRCVAGAPLHPKSCRHLQARGTPHRQHPRSA